MFSVFMKKFRTRNALTIPGFDMMSIFRKLFVRVADYYVRVRFTRSIFMKRFSFNNEKVMPTFGMYFLFSWKDFRTCNELVFHTRRKSSWVPFTLSASKKKFFVHLANKWCQSFFIRVLTWDNKRQYRKHSQQVPHWSIISNVGVCTRNVN